MSKKVGFAPKFPKTVYVYWDESIDEEPVMFVSETPQELATIGNKTLVGVYTLSKTVYAEGKVELTEVK